MFIESGTGEESVRSRSEMTDFLSFVIESISHYWITRNISNISAKLQRLLFDLAVRDIYSMKPFLV